MHNMNISNLV